VGGGTQLLIDAGVPTTLPDGTIDPGIIIEQSSLQEGSLTQFKNALAAHRTFARETDPPLV
jgi:catalase